MGWRFHEDDRFVERSLTAALQAGDWPRRVKGVVRLQGGRSLAIDRVDDELFVRDSAHRRASRIEMIGTNEEDPIGVERIEDRPLATLAGAAS